MKRVISNDIRKSIINAWDIGLSPKIMKDIFEVSVRSVYNIVNRNNKTGSYEHLPLTNSGRKSKLSEEQKQQIKARIKEQPDITLECLISELDLPISVSALCRQVKKWGYRVKKKQLHPKEQKRSDVVKKRDAWKEDQPKLDADDLIFIDESSFNAGMTPLYGRALGGERIDEYVPDVRFERTSIVSGIGLGGPVAPMMYKGTMDKDLFAGYVENFLVPNLRAGNLVFIDNASVHVAVAGEIEELIENVGAKAIFLPPYSPDLNPIELMWSKVKTLVKKAKARTYDALIKAVGEALEAVSKSDIKGWLKHCGYMVNNGTV